jgi:uncharacterized protein (TIGR02466 family)
MKITNHFPTRIFTDKLEPDVASGLNKTLLDLVRADRMNDPGGLSRSNHRGQGGWHSQTKLHQDPAYAELLDHIHRCGAYISEISGYDPRYALQVTTMWSIINAPGASNLAHIHPGSLWSGVYYIQAPQNCGRIAFTDPRTANVMDAPVYNSDKLRPSDTKTKIFVNPEPGKILIFPGWLYHAVDPNMAIETGPDAERVIISFNFVQQYKVQQ